MTFGERVKNYRNLRGFTQKEMAVRCGFKDKSSIAKIESGARDCDQRQIAIIADVLSVSPEALFFDLEDKVADPQNVERDILWHSYSQLNEQQKRAVFMMIQTMLGVEVEK